LAIGAFRFCIEFVKEIQVSFEQTMTLNMGQWLSIPFVVVGIGLLFYLFRREHKNS
jgi:phosphatidylglycerol---prolipoprotein diacylglyceryl transferase